MRKQRKQTVHRPISLRQLRNRFEKQKSTNQELEQLRNQTNAMLAKLQEVSETKQAPADIPDKELEPDEYNAYQTAQLQAEVKTMREQQQLQSVIASANSSLAQGEKTAKQVDYYNAKEFALNAERKRIRATNPLYNNQQVEAALEYNLAVVIANAKQSGRNPSDDVYDYAVQGGYQTSVKQKVNIANINKNQAKSKSLGDTSGASPKTTMTMQNLLDMDGEDMVDWSQDYPEAYAQIMAEGQTNMQLKKKKKRK